MDFFLIISVLVEITCRLFQVLAYIGSSFCRGSWPVPRGSIGRREWEFALLYSVLFVTLPFWVVGLSQLFVGLDFVVPLPADFKP